MKKNKIILMIFVIFIHAQCIRIIISPPGKWENTEKFTINPETKPSKLLLSFLKDDKIIHPENNYYLIFFDIVCGQTNAHYYYSNKLFEKTKHKINWVAVTVYDSIEHFKYRNKLNISIDSLRYSFPVYYSINGLRSSMRNLYFNNLITDKDISAMSFIVINDSIVNYTRGGMHNKNSFLQQKQILDSLFSNKNIDPSNTLIKD